MELTVLAQWWACHCKNTDESFKVTQVWPSDPKQSKRAYYSKSHRNSPHGHTLYKPAWDGVSPKSCLPYCVQGFNYIYCNLLFRLNGYFVTIPISWHYLVGTSFLNKSCHSSLECGDVKLLRFAAPSSECYRIAAFLKHCHTLCENVSILRCTVMWTWMILYCLLLILCPHLDNKGVKLCC